MDIEPGRILLVDNHLPTSELLCADLTRGGYTVTVVDQADVALAMMTEQLFDLILLGLGREGLNSEQLLARLKREPTWQLIPVIVLPSEETASDVLTRALDLGAEDYVLSPFDLRLVMVRIEGRLERLRLRAAQDTNLQKVQRLSHDLQDVILPLGVSLSAEKNIDRLLEMILLQAKSLCHADAGTLYVRTRDERLQFSIMLTDSLGIALGGTTGKEISFPPLRLMDPGTGSPNHRNIATYVALHGHSVNIADIYGTQAFDFTATREFDKRNNYRSVSTLTVPLKNNADQVIAVLQLLNALEPVSGAVVPFDSYQQLVVESLTSQAAVVLNNQLLRQREQELLTFERDLQIGRQIQLGFLPETLPQPPDWQIAARFLPAREVAGDFYDAFMLSQEALGFVIADVCDKGVGSALFMALVRSIIRVYTQQRYSVLAAESTASAAAGAETDGKLGFTGAAIREAVILTNDYIGENHLNMNMFATLFAAVLNLKTGAVVYVNGGHNAPVILTTSGTIVRLRSNGPAVGVVPGHAFEAQHAHLGRGDLLVAFTDGVTDARDPHGKFFTEPRLLRLVDQMGVTPAEQAAATIQESLMEHISTAAQFDDITLMVIRRERARAS